MNDSDKGLGLVFWAALFGVMLLCVFSKRLNLCVIDFYHWFLGSCS